MFPHIHSNTESSYYLQTKEDYELNLRRADELLKEFNKRRTVTEGLLSGRIKPLMEEGIKPLNESLINISQNPKQSYLRDLKVRVDPDLLRRRRIGYNREFCGTCMDEPSLDYEEENRRIEEGRSIMNKRNMNARLQQLRTQKILEQFNNTKNSLRHEIAKYPIVAKRSSHYSSANKFGSKSFRK